MFNVGPLELMVLLVLALIVFGPAKLPELMGSVGRAIREFQRYSSELTEVFQETQQEFSSALDLESAMADSPITETAAEPGANGHAESDVAAMQPLIVDVPATSAPAEYETAAAMIDPVEPYPAPPVEAAEPVAESVWASAAEASPEMSTAAGLVDEPPPFEIKLSHDAPDESAPSVEPEPAIAAKPRRARRPKVAPADPLTGDSSNGIPADAPLTEQDPPSVVADDPPPVASTPGIAASTEPSWISSPLDAGDSPTPAVANGAPRRRSRARAASQGAESP